jgi:hypothetical protein
LKKTSAEGNEHEYRFKRQTGCPGHEKPAPGRGLPAKAAGVNPTLGIIRVGKRPDDVYYENSIIKNCQGLGIETRTYPLMPG